MLGEKTLVNRCRFGAVNLALALTVSGLADRQVSRAYFDVELNI